MQGLVGNKLKFDAPAAEAATSPVISTVTPARARALLVLNAAACLAHSAVGVATLVLVSPDTVLPVSRVAPFFEPNQVATFDVLRTERVGDLSMYALLLSFSLVTAGAHLLQLVRFPRYLQEVRACIAPLRWLEYAITAPIMALLIAQLCFVLDLWLLVAIAVCTATTMSFGLLAELLARPQSDDLWKPVEGFPTYTRFVPHVLGYIPQCFVWVLIIVWFLESTARFNEATDLQVPGFVTVIVLGEVALFWSFGFVQLAVLCARPKYYWIGEIAYITLSLTSKLFLSGICLANATMIPWG